MHRVHEVSVVRKGTKLIKVGTATEIMAAMASMVLAPSLLLGRM